MKFQHVIEAVYAQPWNITLAGWKTVHSIVQPYARGERTVDPKAGLFDDDGTDLLGQPLPAMEILPSGVAIIPVKGVLIQHAGLLEKKFGACSYQDIRSNLRSAVDDGIERIVLDINSPGGQCVGNQEICDFILELRGEGLRIDAFADSLVASAAYNIAAACDTLSITRGTMAGCIGTFLAIVDCSEAFAEAGLKVEMFAVGKYKGAGEDGTKLSEDQKQYFMGVSLKYAAMFKDNVRANRPQVEEASMEGQIIVGTDALEAELVDAIVGDLDEILEAED